MKLTCAYVDKRSVTSMILNSCSKYMNISLNRYFKKCDDTLCEADLCLRRQEACGTNLGLDEESYSTLCEELVPT